MIYEIEIIVKKHCNTKQRYHPPQLFSPTDLVKISVEALHMIQKKHPDYVLAIPEATSYYDMRLVTFGIDDEERLVVCFPIFVKDFNREHLPCIKLKQYQCLLLILTWTLIAILRLW